MKRLAWFLPCLIAAAVAAPLGKAHAAEQIGDVAAGRKLATGWCSNCHGGDPTASEPLMSAPNFAEIANRRRTTAIGLHAFLRSSHVTMPNYILKPAEIDDLSAYILSLRRPRP